MSSLFTLNVLLKVRLADHHGFKGGLVDPKVHGEYTPYYATYDYELICHAPTLMPPLDKSLHKKKILSTDKILVVWVEDLENFEPKTFKQYDIFVLLVIHPLRSGLYRIKIFRTKTGVVTLICVYI